MSEGKLIMDAIVITVTLGEDRRLVVDLPPEMPAGQVDVMITPHAIPDAQHTNPAREAARAKLLAAGILSTTHRAPQGIAQPSAAERERVWTLFSQGRSSDEIIDEDRGDH